MNMDRNYGGFVDPAMYGFSPDASGVENQRALQKALDVTGTIVVTTPGTYRIAGTVFVGGNTTLIFGNNVFLQKVAEQEPFTHVLLNGGALTKTYDNDITIIGLHVIVNGIDVREFLVHGLHGQIAFHYVKDLRIERYRCLDLGKAQYGIHICTFEDVIIDDVIIKGDKDGVHFGKGNRFTLRNGIFQTYDDAVALNGHDYSTGNPELGWIENGIVENCHDLAADESVGYFCRILAGGWVDWYAGMTVQQSDTVVSEGKLYRVFMQPDGTTYTSTTRPTHDSGAATLDGITWRVVQNDVTYTAGVRNVTFRGIFLEKDRIGFSVHFDNDRYSRSYYPGAVVPKQEQLLFDDVRVLHDTELDFLSINTPVDVLNIRNCTFSNGGISFHENKALPAYFCTDINISGCVFKHSGKMKLVKNDVTGKMVRLHMSSNVSMFEDFEVDVDSGEGEVRMMSDYA